MTPKAIEKSGSLGWRQDCDGGQMDGECGAGAEHTFDRQTAPMTIENVLDQREPEPGAALRAAFRDVDAVKSLRQSRDVFGSDAGAVISHGNLCLGDTLQR